MERLTVKLPDDLGTAPKLGYGWPEIADKLAAYEDMMERWAFREIEEIDRLCRRVNALGGTDRMAKYYKAEEQGILIVLPDVPEKDRQSVLDFLRECRADWIHDPSVGLFGPNEEEAALMDAIEAALEVKDNA